MHFNGRKRNIKKKKKKKLRKLSSRDHQTAHITFPFSGSVDRKQILCSLSLRYVQWSIRYVPK